MPGPLQGVKVIELAGIGPGPFCAMMLADMGAEVLRVDRAGSVPRDFPHRTARRPARARPAQHRRRSEESRGRRDGAPPRREGRRDLIEGFRPGVIERLGLGPDVCLARNPRLVYGRMTGWGQDGPLAQAAGHDINYIALTGRPARASAARASRRCRR